MKRIPPWFREPVQRTVLNTYGAGVWGASMLLPRLRHNSNVTWLFVACLPNGGSTAVAKLIGSSSSALLLTPSGEGQWLVPAMSKSGLRWDPNLSLNYAQIRRVWLSRLIGRREHTVVVEKSPPNLCRFPALLEGFRDMPTIALVMSRNPIAVCASWAKRYKPEKVIRAWHPELAGRGLEGDDLAFHEALGSICGQRFEMLRDAAQDAEIVTTYERVAATPMAFREQLVSAIPHLSDVKIDQQLDVKDYPQQAFKNMNSQDIGRLSPKQAAAVRRGLAPYASALANFGYEIGEG